MAITKKAKNIHIKVKGKYTCVVGGTLTKTANRISMEATDGNITLISNKKINIHSEEGIRFGNYTPREERLIEHPEIVEVQFLDEENTILNQTAVQGINNGTATNFIYGKKLKIKVITKETEDDTKIKLNLKGKTKSKNQNFFGIDKLE